MKKTYFFLFLLLFSCSAEENDLAALTSFEDFMDAMEDPSVNQQQAAILKNKIRYCLITRWEDSQNTDSLELQDSTRIYYNASGLPDSIIETPSGSKLYNVYNAAGKLEKRLIISYDLKVVNGSYAYQTDTTTYHFSYSGKQLNKEIIQSPEFGKLSISYSWSGNSLKAIKVHRHKNGATTNYTFSYENGKLKARKIRLFPKEKTGNKTNEFIYKDEQLLEITNTWMLAGNPDAPQMDPEISNTRFTYYPSGKIKSLQKVYGMWPGESFWKSEFRYLNNGLLNEKEMNNGDPEFGPTKISYRYSYEK